jgi:nucleoside-diphosphate-sugar epimerase
MTKKILLMGSTGYIGSHIYNLLKQKNKVYRYSTKNKVFIDDCYIDNFDYIIFAAGVHIQSNKDDKNKFREAINIIKDLYKFFNKTQKIIYISSFKTCINKNFKFISSDKKYNFYLEDSVYGQTKIISEKVFIYLCKKFNKRYKIICPSHVIGNEGKINSINNSHLEKMLKKKIIYYPDCLISLVNINNLSKYIMELVNNNDLDNKKIVLSDATISYQDYVKKIKKNKIYLGIKLNKTLLLFIFSFLEKLKQCSIIKKNPIHKSQIAYLKLNPIVNSDYKGKYSIEEAINSLRKLY